MSLVQRKSAEILLFQRVVEQCELQKDVRNANIWYISGFFADDYEENRTPEGDIMPEHQHFFRVCELIKHNCKMIIHRFADQNCASWKKCCRF